MGAASWLMNLGFGGSDPGAPAFQAAWAVAGEDNDMSGLLRKNVASQNIPFRLVNATDGSALTGATVTAHYAVDTAAQASRTPAGTGITELGNGGYRYVPLQAETNGDMVQFVFTATNAVPAEKSFHTVAFDPTDAVRAGMTALPNAAADAAGGLPISDLGGLDMDAILADTADMQPKLGTPAGASMSADIAAVQADTDNIQTRLPAALVSGKMDSDATALSGSTAAADNLEASAEVIIVGTAQTGTLSTTQMTTNLTEATDDHYNGRIIIWTSGVLLGQATDITAYTGATKLFTFTAVTEAPSNGDTFVIV